MENINNTFMFVEAIIKTSDGQRLLYKYATQKKPSSLLIFIHGYSDHSGSLDRVMRWFFDMGYHVATFDVRGHGKSSARRGYVDHYDYYSNDLH